MAGVKGMHKRLSTSPHYAEKVRARIRAGGIARRLEDHVLGKIQMSSSQVQAALGLLRKVVPDLASVDHQGQVEHHYVARIPDIATSVSEWKQQYSPLIN